MDNATDPDSYDYPTEPIAAPPPVAARKPATPPPAVNWPTVLAAAGAAAVVAALVLTVGLTGMMLTRDGAPDSAAPATVVQLGQTAPVGAAPASAPATSDATAPGSPPADAPLPDAPAADGPLPQASSETSATSSAPSRATQPKPGDPNFKVTADRPTLVDLTNIVNFLVATRASDQAKAANVEGGMAAVVVPRTMYSLGLFRPPLGWSKVTGPLVQSGDTVSATLNSGSAGRPTIRMTIQFKRIGGNWRLAASSMCEGVKTVGLNIYCNA